MSDLGITLGSSISSVHYQSIWRGYLKCSFFRLFVKRSFSSAFSLSSFSFILSILFKRMRFKFGWFAKKNLPSDWMKNRFSFNFETASTIILLGTEISALDRQRENA